MYDPIALAVPLFFVAIGIELLAARRRKLSVYRFTDTITDLGCGITSQVALLFGTSAYVAIYAWVYQHTRLVTLPSAVTAWIVAFVGVDFLYYWWHRLSHQVNVLWAAHVVHHQSEDYNLAVALRQAVLTSWTALPFYLPLAVLGVPPLVFAGAHAASILYQFWIHTRLVGRIGGPLGFVLNLPHHHRVHHAVNPEYLDKNYGATLVVWDRLFGTFAEENEAPVYGLTKPLASFDPLWAQVHYWVELVSLTRTARGVRQKVRVWFASPAWKPDGFPGPSPPVAERPKYERTTSRAVFAYASVNYPLIVAAAFAILMWHGAMPPATLALGAIAVIGGVWGIGALLEGRRWAPAVEGARFVAAVAALAAFASACHGKKDATLHAVDGNASILPRRVYEPASAGSLRVAERDVVVAGKSRRYVRVAPSSLEHERRYPLVLVFHGDGGTAQSFHDAFPFERASGRDAVLAYLDGLGRTWELEPTRDNREVLFAEAVVTELEKELPIDRARVFAVGYSSGGFLSNVIACQKSGLLRAISSSAGGAPYNQLEKWPNGFPKCPGQGPTATLALHGRRDFAVTFDSGRFSAEYWAYVNGCRSDEVETTGYDECRAYRGCPPGKAVVFCDVPPLAHWVWDHAAEASWTFFQSQ